MTASHPFPHAANQGGSHDKRIRARGSWKGSMKTAVESRGFAYDIDEPVQVGGTNSAPTPMEYVIGALNGCVGVVIEQVAGERGIDFTGLETYAIATQDTRGFAGVAGIQPYFHSCRLDIHLETGLDDAAAQALLKDEVHRRCPAINLLAAAGVDLDIHWVFAANVGPDDAEISCNAALGYDSSSRALAGGRS